MKESKTIDQKVKPVIIARVMKPGGPFGFASDSEIHLVLSDMETLCSLASDYGLVELSSWANGIRQRLTMILQARRESDI